MSFSNIEDRANKIIEKFGESLPRGKSLKDDTYYGESVRALYEGLKSKYTLEYLRDNDYHKSCSIVENFKKIKDARMALEQDHNLKDQYDIIITSQEAIIKEIDSIEANKIKTA
jgi:hypothetical protein